MRTAAAFALGLLLWGLLPVAIAYVIFLFRLRYAAWGWLLAITAYSYFSLAYVLQSESSTAAVDFLWAPAWSIVVFGPAGALCGALLARVRRSKQPS
jgi:hypothetical protein